MWKVNVKASCGNSRSTELHQFDFFISQQANSRAAPSTAFRAILFFEDSSKFAWAVCEKTNVIETVPNFPVAKNNGSSATPDNTITSNV